MVQPYEAMGKVRDEILENSRKMTYAEFKEYVATLPDYKIQLEKTLIECILASLRYRKPR